MAWLGYLLIGIAVGWIAYKLYVSYTSAGGTDFALPVYDAAYYPPVLLAVGLYFVLSAFQIDWSVWLYVGVWLGSAVLVGVGIKLLELLGDKPL